MISTMRPRVLTLAAAAFLAGCGADSSVSTTNTPLTLDEVFTEMRLPAISGATSAAAGVSASVAAPGTSVPAGCSYATSSQSFVCAPFTTIGGLTITQSYQLLNSSGSPLAAFDASALAAVRTITTTTGTESNAAGTFTLDGRQDQTLSGLQTSRHVLNGVATMNITTTYGTGTSATTMKDAVTTTTSDLVIPANAGPNTYPASGTITIDISSTSSFLPMPPSRFVMTFNGTSKVKVTINGAPVPGCSTIDLSSTTPGCS